MIQWTPRTLWAGKAPLVVWVPPSVAAPAGGARGRFVRLWIGKGWATYWLPNATPVSGATGTVEVETGSELEASGTVVNPQVLARPRVAVRPRRERELVTGRIALETGSELEATGHVEARSRMRPAAPAFALTGRFSMAAATGRGRLSTTGRLRIATPPWETGQEDAALALLLED